MKWQVVDEKHNSAKNIIQKYNIDIETTKSGNTLEAKVTVPACPRGQRPVVWSELDVMRWLNEKGYDITSTLQSETLSDAVANTVTYSFSLKQKQTVSPTNRVSKKTIKKKRKTTTASTRVINAPAQTEED